MSGVGAVYPGLLAGSSLHFSLHRSGRSRASGPDAQMWLCLRSPGSQLLPRWRSVQKLGSLDRSVWTDKETLCRDPVEAPAPHGALTLFPSSWLPAPREGTALSVLVSTLYRGLERNRGKQTTADPCKPDSNATYLPSVLKFYR